MKWGLLLFILMPIFATAQSIDTAAVYITVAEFPSRKPVPMAEVAIESYKTVFTDIDGKALVCLPHGTYTISIAALPYFDRHTTLTLPTHYEPVFYMVWDYTTD